MKITKHDVSFEQLDRSVDATPIATFLKLSLTVLLIGALLALVALRFFAPSQTLSSAGALVMVLVALLGRYLLGCGRIAAATSVAIFGFWSTLAMGVVSTGGLLSPLVIGFPVVILSVGWLISANAAWLVTGLTVCTTLVLLLAEGQHYFPDVSQPSVFAYASDQVIFYVICAILTVFFRHAYHRRLRDLRRMGLTLAQRTDELESRTAELGRAQSVANIGSWTYDIPTNHLELSPAARQIMRCEHADVFHFEGYVRLFHPEEQGTVARAWQAALAGAEFDEEHRIGTGDDVRWIRQIAETARSTDGTPQSMVGTMQDVTERKLAQLALSESEKRYRVMTEWSPDSILVHARGTILYANRAANRLFGSTVANALVGKTVRDLIPLEPTGDSPEEIFTAPENEDHFNKVETRLLRLDGTLFDVEMHGTSIIFSGEPATHFSLRDITERKQMESVIRHQALYDALTQLPNRRLFDDRLGQALSSNRRSGHHSGLLFMDLDNFKPLNDRHGHAVGDLLLVKTANRLNRCVREADTVARFGGDEFVVLLTELSTNHDESVAFTRAVAEKIISVITKPFQLTTVGKDGAESAVEHHCSISIGVVVFAGVNVPQGALIECADEAMYTAKANGRGQVCFSGHAMARTPT